MLAEKGLRKTEARLLSEVLPLILLADVLNGCVTMDGNKGISP